MTKVNCLFILWDYIIYLKLIALLLADELQLRLLTVLQNEECFAWSSESKVRDVSFVYQDY